MPDRQSNSIIRGEIQTSTVKRYTLVIGEESLLLVVLQPWGYDGARYDVYDVLTINNKFTTSLSKHRNLTKSSKVREFHFKI